ncbi:MAG: hypothetical protein RL194_673, partial [Pseudomonadota bacterium]
IEDDLADKARNGLLPATPALIEYGVSRDEAQRFGIPCGGRLQIFVEPLRDAGQLKLVIAKIEQGRLVKRSVRLDSGEIRLAAALPGSAAHLGDDWLHAFFGPQWRLLIIGANQLASVLASMAQTLEFDVLVCDPREDIKAQWHIEGTTWLDGMPDDVVKAIRADAHTAIVAVTHDPKLDDMALLEALKCDAFYVGALGSRKNQEKRRERMRMFDLTEEEISRLHGPVGLPIGSRTPAEIAIAILAEIIQQRTLQREAAAQSAQCGQSSACTK